MSKKKLLALIPAVLLLLAAALALFNILVDPCGVFGDPIYHWYGYDETTSPGVAKVEWLEDHPGAYDSFILGSSQAASLDPERLEAYLGGSFYNMFTYKADADDYRDMAKYLVKNYQVRNIVLCLGISDCLSFETGEESLATMAHPRVSGRSLFGFYLKMIFGNTERSLDKLASRSLDAELPQDFDLFLPETGLYDRRALDAEAIGDLAAYEALHAGDFAGDGVFGDLTHIEKCVSCVREIREACDSAGARLTVILSPEYITRFNSLSAISTRRFREELAQVTDFWDFALTPLSYDSRYFYDIGHFRDAAGDMVLARVFSDTSVWSPEGFGAHVTAENCGAYVEDLYSAGPLPEEDFTVDLPILLYHHMVEEPSDPSYSSREGFENQLKLIQSAGFTTISLEELRDYVFNGGSLPEKPVLLTFDDGYASNYEIAYPLLEKYGMKAAFFPIGVSIGKSTYKDTGFAMTPHYGFDEAREMTASGLVEIGSHTWDMHQWPPFETGNAIRENILPFEGEDEADYLAVLRADLATCDETLRRELGEEGIPALAYPSGQYNALVDAVVRASGVPITLSTRTDRRNLILRGLPESLRTLSRWTVADATTEEELLSILDPS